MSTVKNLYRCLNPLCKNRGQHFEFQSDEAVCPRCKIEQTHERFGHLIRRLPRVHYEPMGPIPGYGSGHRACAPSMSICAQAGPTGVPEPWHAGTGDMSAVTCPECLASEALAADKQRLKDEAVAAQHASASVERLLAMAQPG